MSEVKILDSGAKYSHVSAGKLKGFEGKQFVRMHRVPHRVRFRLARFRPGLRCRSFTAIRQTRRII